MKFKKYQHILLLSLLSLGVVNTSFSQNTEPSASVDSTAVKAAKKTYIGYGQQNDTIMTSAVSTVKGNDLEKVFNTDLGNMLYGRIAGLTVEQGGSEAGFNSPSIFIRGVNTFASGRSPLVIIDGFISDYSSLVPQEIEEISVLKDASATSIYGMRGANGVLLVTTKRGVEGPLKIGFRSQWGFNQVSELPQYVDAFNYATLINESRTNVGLEPLYTTDALDAYRSGSNPTSFPDVNWYDEVLRKTAPVSNYNLNFSGGNETAKYFVMLGAINSQGMLKDFTEDVEESALSKFSRYNFRSNLDLKLTKRLSANVSFGGNVQDQSNPRNLNSSTVFDAIGRIAPNRFPIYAANGEFASIGGVANPLGNLVAGGFQSSNSRTLQSALRLDQQLDMLAKGLSAFTSLSYNSFYSSLSSKLKNVLTYDPSGTSVITNGSPIIPFEADINQNRIVTFQAGLNFNRAFGDHDISSLLMYNTDNIREVRDNPGTSLANNNLPYRSNAAMGRFTYVNQGKYIGEVSFNYMGTEAFPKGSRYGFFPAASLGWVVSKESFLNTSSSVNFLKIRGSYGLVGNDLIGQRRFLFDQLYSGTGSVFTGNNSNSQPALTQDRPGTPGVTWEKEVKANFGLDATLFERFDVSFDVFKNRRRDILSPEFRSTPSYLGYNNRPFINQGRTNNRGYEVSVRYNSDKSSAFKYFVEGLFSGAYNKIEFNGEALELVESRYLSGHPIDTRFGYRSLGFLTQDEIDNGSAPLTLFPGLRPGDIKYQDLNGDGFIDPNDVGAIGNAGIPTFTAGLHTGFRYKSFDLDLVIQGVTGVDAYYGGGRFHGLQNDGSQISTMALQRWTPETASSAIYPRLTLPGDLNNYMSSTFWQRDGSFLRLRSAELGYNLPVSLTRAVRLSESRIFINGTNLITLDRLKFAEAENLGNGYPPIRTISFGLRLGI